MIQEQGAPVGGIQGRESRIVRWQGTSRNATIGGLANSTILEKYPDEADLEVMREAARSA
jgi:hypothetical protein